MLAPDSTINVGHGILVAGMNPMLNHIVDIRHASQYGIINGIYTASYNLGLGVGKPVLFAVLHCFIVQLDILGPAEIYN